jgi:hypothetical protein
MTSGDRALIQALAKNQLRRYDREFDASDLSWRDFTPGATEDLETIRAAGWYPTEDLPEHRSEGRLRTCPAHPGHAPFLATHVCPWCTITSLRAGVVSVTPEQVEAARLYLVGYYNDLGWAGDAVRGVIDRLGLTMADGDTANQLLAAGWRRATVTPEQVVDAAKAIEAVEAQSTHTTFAMARAALYSVGLSVAEGETT